MVRKRALAISEEVEIASQAVRPAHEDDDREESPSSLAIEGDDPSDMQTFGSLQELHGADLVPEVITEIPPTYRRPAVYEFRLGGYTGDTQGRIDNPSMSQQNNSGMSLTVAGDGDWPADWLEPEGSAPSAIEADADLASPSEQGAVAAVDKDEQIPAHRSSAQATTSSNDQPPAAQAEAAATQSSSADSSPIIQRGLSAFRAAATRYGIDGPCNAGPSRPRVAPQSHLQQLDVAHDGRSSKIKSSVQSPSPSFETPCPRRPIANSRIRTGPIALLNSHRGITTSDVIEGQDGGHAVPDALPIDPEKRQKQQEAFKAVKPITGRGPYSYYTNSASRSSNTAL